MWKYCTVAWNLECSLDSMFCCTKYNFRGKKLRIYVPVVVYTNGKQGLFLMWRLCPHQCRTGGVKIRGLSGHFLSGDANRGLYSSFREATNML